jgi:hypothetical protein
MALAAELARHARSGKLVPFLGAGLARRPACRAGENSSRSSRSPPGATSR